MVGPSLVRPGEALRWSPPATAGAVPGGVMGWRGPAGVVGQTVLRARSRSRAGWRCGETEE
ncbi:hypothetical protein ADL05_06910 [Nocardiopsis sp. NRRL B-16309]|nr:hypothetical protein ADL05_06910 [Nocardiopsis sp. NRRL B-16309]